MAGFSWVILVVAILVFIVGIIVVISARRKPKKFKGKYPEGHFIGKGMMLFTAAGVAIGLAMNNIALGIGIGVAIGVAIGASWEEKAKKERKIRPMTKAEKVRKNRAL